VPLLIALGLPLGAQAADWVRVDVNDQHQHFYDRSKVQVDQDVVTYWRRVVFRTPQTVRGGAARMAMYRESIDCTKHTYRALGYLLYGQDGAVLENVYTPDAAGEAIVPETVGDRFEALMCVFADQARVSQAKARAELPADASAADIRAQIEHLETELDVLRARLQKLAPGEGPAPVAGQDKR
jgi:uncharacterized protein YceH (UPF0502 family)